VSRPRGSNGARRIGGGGLHWLPFAFVLAVTIAASNAWILLVEVLR